jgi:hypothetical protein
MEPSEEMSVALRPKRDTIRVACKERPPVSLLLFASLPSSRYSLHMRSRTWAGCWLIASLLAGALAAQGELAVNHLPGETRAVKVAEANGGAIRFTAEARAGKAGDWALATRRHPSDPPLATARFDAWPNGSPVPFVLHSDGRRSVSLTLSLAGYRAAVTYPSRQIGDVDELFVSVLAVHAGTRVTLAGLTLDGAAVKDAPAAASAGARAQDVLRIQGVPLGHGFTLAGTIALGWEGTRPEGSDLRVRFWGAKGGRQAAGEAPKVTITAPAAESVLANGTPTVIASFTGATAPVVTLLLDGADRTAEAEVSAAGLSFTPSARLLEGKHTAQVIVRDRAGHEGRAAVSFVTDTVPPSIVFASPGPVTDNPAPVIRLSYSDATSGLDPPTLKVTLDGESIDSICIPNAASGVCLTESVPEGSHRLTATVRDRAGNVGRADFGFTVEAPVEAPPDPPP